jgi:uncharacterized protein YdeI (YjbR/CyaY-like superfamily)
MNPINPKVNWFFNKAGKWQDAYERLRTIVLDCGLTEELKWGCPCYTVGEDNNVVLIHGFKDYCALLFMKGALLKDAEGILVQQTKNVQSARQIRFKHVDEIQDMESTLKAYIKQAIKIEKDGVKVPLKKTSEFEMAAEFRNVLNKNPRVKKAFYTLTPGRQRGYLLYFSSAKQSKTREARIEKYTANILKGKGLED